MKALQDFYEFLITLNKFIFTFLYTIDSLLFKSEIFLWKITETYAFLIYIPKYWFIIILNHDFRLLIFFNTHYLFWKILQNNHRNYAYEIFLKLKNHHSRNLITELFSNFLSSNSSFSSKNTNSTTKQLQFHREQDKQDTPHVSNKKKRHRLTNNNPTAISTWSTWNSNKIAKTRSNLMMGGKSFEEFSHGTNILRDRGGTLPPSKC